MLVSRRLPLPAAAPALSRSLKAAIAQNNSKRNESRPLFQEKADHDSGSVEPDALRICPSAVSAEPCVPAVLDKPVLDDRSALGILEDRATDASAIGLPIEGGSLERVRAALGLLEDPFAVGRVDRRIGAAVKDDFAAAAIVCGLGCGINDRASFHRGESGRHVDR